MISVQEVGIVDRYWLEPKPHIRKLDTGSWGYFDSRDSIMPSYVANDIRFLSLLAGRVKPLPHWMRRNPNVMD